MKINAIKNIYTPILVSVLSCCPIKTANNVVRQYGDTFCKTTFTSKITEDLKVEKYVNFVGGVSTRFDSASVQKLKQRILKPQNKISYCFPLKGTTTEYTEPFGAFMAKRPGGRPHLGLDIFTTPYAKKPKEPVTIVSPVEGYVISQKHARKEDNVISNAITILGVDGRRYSFDHMARGTDYQDAIPMPRLGAHVSKGTPLGYMGSTGETTLWHLHLYVMTDEKLAYQLKSKQWLDYAAKSQYSQLRGQVDPLNRKEAGPIADILNERLK